MITPTRYLSVGQDLQYLLVLRIYLIKWSNDSHLSRNATDIHADGIDSWHARGLCELSVYRVLSAHQVPCAQRTPCFSSRVPSGDHALRFWDTNDVMPYTETIKPEKNGIATTDVHTAATKNRYQVVDTHDWHAPTLSFPGAVCTASALPSPVGFISQSTASSWWCLPAHVNVSMCRWDTFCFQYTAW